MAAITMGCSKSSNGTNYTTAIQGKWTEVQSVGWYEPKAVTFWF
jgi:hypothetical protein